MFMNFIQIDTINTIVNKFKYNMIVKQLIKISF